MNDTRRSRRLRSIPNSPLSHFIFTRRKETTQVHDFAHGRDSLGQCRFRAEFLTFLVDFGLGFEGGESFLEGDGDGEDWVAGGVFLEPFHDFGEVFVFLTEVVFFAEVDHVDYWFGGEEEERVDYFDLSDKIVSKSAVDG